MVFQNYVEYKFGENKQTKTFKITGFLESSYSGTGKSITYLDESALKSNNNVTICLLFNDFSWKKYKELTKLSPSLFSCFSDTDMYTEQAAFILFFHALCVRGDFLMVYDKVSFTGISGHGCPRKPASDTDVRCRRSRPLSNPPPHFDIDH